MFYANWYFILFLNKIYNLNLTVNFIMQTEQKIYKSPIWIYIDK
jgi:hypothetical protein